MAVQYNYHLGTVNFPHFCLHRPTSYHNLQEIAVEIPWNSLIRPVRVLLVLRLTVIFSQTRFSTQPLYHVLRRSDWTLWHPDLTFKLSFVTWTNFEPAVKFFFSSFDIFSFNSNKIQLPNTTYQKVYIDIIESYKKISWLKLWSPVIANVRYEK